MSDSDGDMDFRDDSDSNSSHNSDIGIGIMGESDDDDDDNHDFSDSDSFSGASLLSIDDNDVPAIDLAEETCFNDDEEDAEAFCGVSKHHYNSEILPLKNSTKQFFNYNFHSRLSDIGKMRLGSFLAHRADTDNAGVGGLVQVHLILKEERPQSVGKVFRGPFQHDHALRRFKIRAGDEDIFYGVKLSLNDWNCVSQYLRKAPSLHHLDLAGLSLGRGELELLASALRGVKLKTLGLQSLTDEADSLGVLLASINATTLETIEIVGCSAGVATCEGLANILCSNGTKLEILNLDANPIDDNCVQELCNSLAENRSLKILHLNDMEDITDEGWAMFKKLVFDKTSLESIYQSNHTLEHVAGYPHSPDVFQVNKARGNGYRNKGHTKIFSFLTSNNIG